VLLEKYNIDSFNIEDEQVIKKILKHLGLWETRKPSSAAAKLLM